MRSGLLVGFSAVPASGKGWSIAARKTAPPVRLSSGRLGQVDGEDGGRWCFEDAGLGARCREIQLSTTQESRDHRGSRSLLGRPALKDTGESLT